MSESGTACIVSKMSGMCYVREDVTPSILEWKAIEQPKTITVPLKSLVKLQASKENRPDLILRVFYKVADEEKDIRLKFTNRPAMNHVKEALQTIISRQRTTIQDDKNGNGDVVGATGAASTPKSSNNGTPVPSSTTGGGNDAGDGTGANSLNLGDDTLLNNRQLQQKLLLEDKSLRNVFTQSVINYKLPLRLFWSTRINLLRTYALTTNQHRGPYNVLSTIRPVATSDNQVNVNVTRNTINEIFDTYPIVKRAFNDLVPVKFLEGEFWSRFFNSKLFRRLRGDKINNTNERGDMVLDKYLYINQEHVSGNSDSSKTDGTAAGAAAEPQVVDKQTNNQAADSGVKNKFIDLLANEEDNSTKLPKMPDFTMKFDEDSRSGNKSEENEMIILLKNMNNLSSKMITQNQEADSNQSDAQDRDKSPTQENIEEYEQELNLNDLNDYEDTKFIDLKINPNINENSGTEETIPLDELNSYLKQNKVSPSTIGINLVDTYKSKDAINESASEINNLIKLNFKTYKLINNSSNSSSNGNNNNLLSNSLIEEIFALNVTINEFLTHFWNFFLFESNPNQLKKIFANLKDCKKKFTDLKQKSIDYILSNPQFAALSNVSNPDAASASGKRDKVINDLNYCLNSIVNPLDKALSEYVKAVKASRDPSSMASNGDATPQESEVEINNEVNENGKRAIKA